MLGCAQTGTGKTAAFALPIRSASPPPGPPATAIRCLVLTPTRELANQIGESFATYGKFIGLNHTVIFGGVVRTRRSRRCAAAWTCWWPPRAGCWT